MEGKNIIIPFSASLGEIIDMKELLKEELGDNESNSRTKSSVLQNIQSKMGTVVHGYDEGDDFIDDSDIVNRTLQPQNLDPQKFKVVISYPSKEQKPKEQKSAETTSSEPTIVETREINEAIQSCLEKIKARVLSAFPPGTKPNDKFKFPPPLIDAIVECVDTYDKIEQEKLQPPISKKKLEQIRRDVFDLIYAQCFNTGTYFLATKQKIQRTYRNAKKALEPKKDDEEPLKEEPGNIPEEAVKVLSNAGVNMTVLSDQKSSQNPTSNL